MYAHGEVEGGSKKATEDQTILLPAIELEVKNPH
jgi:hypothetical protein